MAISVKKSGGDDFWPKKDAQESAIKKAPEESVNVDFKLGAEKAKALMDKLTDVAPKVSIWGAKGAIQKPEFPEEKGNLQKMTPDEIKAKMDEIEPEKLESKLDRGPYYPDKDDGKMENLPYHPDKDDGKMENLPYHPEDDNGGIQYL